MFRRGAILALVFFLAACGGSDVRAPFTDSHIPPSLGPDDWPPPGWAWGLIQIGDRPPQRYGVAAPLTMSTAQVLILPGYGQAAEDEFPLANDLIGQGVEVWALDSAGQGGSGRIGPPRDLGQLDSFDSELIAIERMNALTIRPTPQAPMMLIADGTTGLTALRRLQLGAPGVAGLVLRAPTLSTPGGAAASGAIADWAGKLGLKGLRAPGAGGWSRDGAEIGGGLNPQTAHAWRLANPDLRMGGPSLGWLAAFERLQRDVAAGGFGRVATPVLILGSDADSPADRAWRDQLCRGLARCVQERASDEPGSDRQILAFVQALQKPIGAAPQGVQRPLSRTRPSWVRLANHRRHR